MSAMLVRQISSYYPVEIIEIQSVRLQVKFSLRNSLTLMMNISFQCVHNASILYWWLSPDTPLSIHILMIALSDILTELWRKGVTMPLPTSVRKWWIYPMCIGEQIEKFLSWYGTEYCNIYLLLYRILWSTSI